MSQISFLQRNKIALTDLLISVRDANINQEIHVNWINDYQDDNFNNFEDLYWNTTNILQYITEKKVKAVYFTKVSEGRPFGRQITAIKRFCRHNNILVFKLHTPSGQRLGPGIPRENRLIHKWWLQGGNHFPFLCPNFDINSPDFFGNNIFTPSCNHPPINTTKNSSRH